MLIPPFNLKSWIKENRHLLKPPVNNKVIYKDADFIIMVVGGPNSRKDFHYNEGEEFFYQLEGTIEIVVQQNGKAETLTINEGDIFLLPAKVPHNPKRGPNTIGLVVEHRKKNNEKDGLLWFCENCNTKLHEVYFNLTDIATQFQGEFKRFYTSTALRTCKQCGHMMEPPPTIA